MRRIEFNDLGDRVNVNQLVLELRSVASDVQLVSYGGSYTVTPRGEEGEELPTKYIPGKIVIETDSDLSDDSFFEIMRAHNPERTDQEVERFNWEKGREGSYVYKKLLGIISDLVSRVERLESR